MNAVIGIPAPYASITGLADLLRMKAARLARSAGGGKHPLAGQIVPAIAVRPCLGILLGGDPSLRETANKWYSARRIEPASPFDPVPPPFAERGMVPLNREKTFLLQNQNESPQPATSD